MQHHHSSNVYLGFAIGQFIYVDQYMSHSSFPENIDRYRFGIYKINMKYVSVFFFLQIILV